MILKPAPRVRGGVVILLAILLLLAAGVVAWASERFIGANAPRWVSLTAFAAGLAWAAFECWSGAADGLYAAQSFEWIPPIRHKRDSGARWP